MSKLRNSCPLPASGLFALLATATAVNAQIPTSDETRILRAPPEAGYSGFGEAVAIDGDTAIVGAPLDDSAGDDFGAIYVFTRQDGGWSLQQRIVPTDSPALENCGAAVAVSGDTLAFNCEGDYLDTLPRTYFYNRSGDTWTQDAVFTLPRYYSAPEGLYYDIHDIAGLAIDGDVAVVGDHGRINYTPGRAHMYIRDEGSWRQLWELERENAWPNDAFGSTIDIQDRTVVVGAPNTLIDTTDQKGTIHIYEAEEDIGNWPGYTQFRKTGAARTGFGDTVAVDGDTVVVGRENSNGRRGEVHVYQRSGGDWAFQSSVLPGDARWYPDTGVQFGHSVAMDGGILAVSSNDGRDPTRRVVYILRQSGDFAWDDVAKLSTSAGPPVGEVALSGNTVIAGVHRSYDRYNDPGAAYIFELPDIGPPPEDLEGPRVNLVDVHKERANYPLRILAVADDRESGGSAIDSASATLANDEWMSAALPMEADDGAFDTARETIVLRHESGLPAGLYNLCVAATDASGNTGEDRCALLGVEDQEAGFVTGGGWLPSPEGAYTADSGVAGKAHFELEVRYEKGRITPRAIGTVAFELPSANLSFSSVDSPRQLEWLVIDENHASIRGYGQINGEGSYGFMLGVEDAGQWSPTDGMHRERARRWDTAGRLHRSGSDQLRIRIWDIRDDNRVIYDNQAGIPDIERPTAAIGGGAIRIHRPGNGGRNRR